MLKEMLKEKNLPGLKTREEMLEILQREEYGYLPPKPDSVEFNVIEKSMVPVFCAGKAELSKIEIVSKIGDKTFAFPMYATLPTKPGKYPFFVHINFRPYVPDMYMPTEELIDNGFAVLSFCYQDVTSDDNDFTNGLAGVLYGEDTKEETRGISDPGKIAMWAWAAHRVMDYAQTLDCLDLSKAIVCGHSRLGKTALVAGATDERFTVAYSNDSGTGGAAIARGKIGERIEDSCTMVSYWYCNKYKSYVNRENEMPFDQHYLLASVAPRRVYVASAEQDSWADPSHEMLSCVAASGAYEKMGLKGLVCENRLPQAGDIFHDGYIGYHMRTGAHFFSREDWLRVIEYVKKHLW